MAGATQQMVWDKDSSQTAVLLYHNTLSTCIKYQSFFLMWPAVDFLTSTGLFQTGRLTQAFDESLLALMPVIFSHTGRLFKRGWLDI